MVGEAQREAAAIVGILGALDQAGADQRIDRAADGRSAAPDLRAIWLRVAGSAEAMADSSRRRARSARSAGPSATQAWATLLNRDAMAAGVDPPNMIAT